MASTGWAERRKTTTVGFEVFTPGVANFYVKNAEATTSKKGKEQFKLRVVFVDGPMAGKGITEFITVSPESEGAMSIFFQNVAVLGVDEAFLASDPTSAQIAEKMMGAYFTTDLTNEEYPAGSGTIRNRLGFFKPYTGTAGVGEDDVPADTPTAADPASAAPAPPF